MADTPIGKFGRTYEQGPYGTVHGGAQGKVWNTGRKFEIEIEGQSVVAGLLEEEAPRTCEAFANMLPLEAKVLSLRWSGDGFQTHHPQLEKMAADSELLMENFTTFAGRGDIMFWVRDRGLFFCYNYMHSRGITGEEPPNLFAHVDPQYYSVLYEMGLKIYKEGEKLMRIRLLE